jgi:enoyl-CoA hydratase/carnithine racemase
VFEAATATADKLAAKPAGALQASKRLIKQEALGPLKETVANEMREFTQRVTGPEAKEAFSAFIEKRPPNFSKLAPSQERKAA